MLSAALLALLAAASGRDDWRPTPHGDPLSRPANAQGEWRPSTHCEPFRIKVVEPIQVTTRKDREAALAAAGHNMFRLRADDVMLDFLTDSGTGAMSAAQWAAMVEADEAYAGARAWALFEASFRDLFDFEHLLPTHQGRAAERLLFAELGGEGKRFYANTFFDTTRANIESTGATATNLPATHADHDRGFGGNIDLEAMRKALDEGGAAAVVITATNNAGGGQPVSLANMRAASELCRAKGVPLVLDGCRFAENSFFVSQHERGQLGRPVKDIVRAMSPLFDAMTMSAKKDGLSNTGGWLAVRDPHLARRLQQRLILTEGFTTYGGMAGRDLAAIAVGLREVVDEHYLRYRLRTVSYMAGRLVALGVPVLTPPGGHAVYLDAGAMLPHLAPGQLPGQAVACALYVEGGVRSCEIGTLMFGDAAPPRQLVRLAFPRRMYTQAHIDYAIEVCDRVNQLCAHGDVRGYRIVEGANEPLRHFSAVLAPEEEGAEVEARGEVPEAPVGAVLPQETESEAAGARCP